MAVMRADLANKEADTDYKRGLLKAEFWKVMVAVITATAGLFGVLGAILGYVLAHTH